jgi:RNA polymerase sigma factor (sigma-70 family)
MTLEAMESTIPKLELAYAKLTPLFFRALAILARKGFVVSPTDGMDVIHDFFTEAWNGLETNFDPQKGSFEGYAYGAFVQFARPRIVRLRRWQYSLIAADELDAFPSNVPEGGSELDQELIRQAIARLPTREQEILRRFVYSDFASERALAKDFHVSRYRLHEILVEALGRVAAALDRPARIAPQDWEVARALWRDYRTISETAGVLQLTAHQVRRANTRNIQFISEALQQYRPRKRPEMRRNEMGAPQPMLSAPALFKLALMSPGNKDLLSKLTAHASEILAGLETFGCPISEREIENIAPTWIAEVYEAIFRGTAQPDASKAEAFISAHHREDEAIGAAFRETLLADLPPALREPSEFHSLRPIARGESGELRNSPDVKAAVPEVLPWIEYGITPLTVFYATEAVSGLLSRLLRRGFLHEGGIILGDKEAVFVDDEKKTFKLDDSNVEEIAQMAECNHDIAKALYSWLLKVAPYKTWLFAGFRAEPRGTAVKLTPSPETFESVYQRWGLIARAIEVSA